ncbi:hypothetical protein VULLAG_LOCUS22954 [Vulpes lagopus]
MSGLGGALTTAGVGCCRKALEAIQFLRGLSCGLARRKQLHLMESCSAFLLMPQEIHAGRAQELWDHPADHQQQAADAPFTSQLPSPMLGIGELLRMFPLEANYSSRAESNHVALYNSPVGPQDTWPGAPRSAALGSESEILPMHLLLRPKVAV